MRVMAGRREMQNRLNQTIYAVIGIAILACGAGLQAYAAEHDAEAVRLNNDGVAWMNQQQTEKAEVSFVYPENANHILKHEALPIAKLTAQYVGEHYNASDAKLDEGAANSILGWLGEEGHHPAAE